MTTPPLKAPPARAKTVGGWLAAGGAAQRPLRQTLLQALLGLDRAAVLRSPERRLLAAEECRLRHALERYADHEPLAYITGEQPFHDILLRVDARALAPRPETELLVSFAVDWMRERSASCSPSSSPFQLLDLGTGSGAIAMALEAQAARDTRLRFRVTATDRCADALALAEENHQRLGSNARLLQSDWFSALGGERFDLIVSNPPYLAQSDPHLPQLRHEPQAALVAARNGLADLQHIVEQAPHHLHPGGSLYLEHGSTQAPAVRDALKAAGFEEVETFRDWAGHERISGGTLHAGRNSTSDG